MYTFYYRQCSNNVDIAASGLSTTITWMLLQKSGNPEKFIPYHLTGDAAKMLIKNWLYTTLKCFLPRNSHRIFKHQTNYISTKNHCKQKAVTYKCFESISDPE